MVARHGQKLRQRLHSDALRREVLFTYLVGWYLVARYLIALHYVFRRPMHVTGTVG